MSILKLDGEALQIDAVECSDTELIVSLKDGRRIAAPLWWLPRLLNAAPEQRAASRIMPFGDAIEWPEIDEHVSVKGLLRGKPAPGPSRRGQTDRERVGCPSFAFLAESCDKRGRPSPATGIRLTRA
jgi:Protein of unknown function (DUF2442)